MTAKLFSARSGVEERRVLTNILALDDAVLDGTSKTLAGLLLVSVVTSTVEKTVAGLERVVDGLVPQGQTALGSTETRYLRPRTEVWGPRRGVSAGPGRGRASDIPSRDRNFISQEI